MLKVSVITPVYNGEKTIARCVDSILAQTLTETEIIVVNDGSTDKTAEILSGYKNIRVINQENAGQGFARNRGIDAARGEYIAFVDADDTIEPNMLAAMYAAAKESGAEITQCAINDIRGESVSVRPKTARENVSAANTGEYIFKYIRGLTHTYEVCNKLFLTSFVKENNLRFYDTKIYHCEDLIFNFDAVSHLKTIAFLPQAMYNYYISDAGHNRRDKKKKITGLIKAFEEVTAHQSDIGAKKAAECIAAVIILSECSGGDSGFSREILCTKEVKRYMKTSMTYKSGIKHSALMAAMLYMPDKIRIKILNTHFCYD
ncbi:MAG: glycosyltransferase [Firmicutes bacterium]|nr:glycosyltransferase [Bacillota bacterium]